MKFRRALTVALVALPLSVAPAANADNSAAPPFTTTDAWADCASSPYIDDPIVDAIAGDSCSADADATEAGSMSAELSLVTSHLPLSSGGANGEAHISTTLWVEGASSVSYTVTYQVSNAHATMQSQATLPTSTIGAGTALIGSVYAPGSTPPVEFARSLASTNAAPLPDGTYTEQLLLATDDGSTMNGPVVIGFFVWSMIDAYNDGATITSTTVSTGANVQILSVTSQIIE
jgi:hypothetical protein